MRPQLLLLVSLLIVSFSASSQISSFTTTEGTTCSNSADGSITLDSIEGCFAPITVIFDNDTHTFEVLKNDGYHFIHHGEGTQDDYSDDVWAGSSSLGDVYIATGSFEDSVTFDNSTTMYGATGDYSMFLVCFDADDNSIIWATSASVNGSNLIEGYGVTADPDNGAVYVTGYFNGTANFQTQNLVSSGGIQSYIAKYDLPTGSLDTAIQVGNAGTDIGYDINFTNDRVYLAGSFTNSITLAGNALTSGGQADAFITSFSPDLTNNIWGAKAGGSGNDHINELAVGQNTGVTERIFVTGNFNATATFGGQNILSSGQTDFFIAAIDTVGTWLWAEGGGSGGDFDAGYGIDVNPDGDEVYFGGSMQAGIIFDGQPFVANGPVDGFIATMDTAGTLLNFYQFDGGQSERVHSVKCIDDGFLIFSGQIEDSITFADSTFYTSGSIDAFVGKIGLNDHEIWGKNFGGTGDDDFIYSIDLADNKTFNGAGYFVLDASAYQAGLISAGSYDAIVTHENIMGIFDTTIVADNLTGGDYYIVMTDSNGNTVIDTITVTSPDPIVINGIVTNTSSAASSDGAIDITATGGTPGYEYFWSTTAITQDISNLTAGTYTVVVSDTLGCLDTATFVVDTGGSPLVMTSLVTQIQCFGDLTGSINLTLTGGVPPFTFDWSNSATTEDLNGIGAGTYTVTITDSDTSEIIDTFTITQPAQLVISGTITPPTSGTSNNGAVNITVTGGVTPYTYAWSNSQTTEDINGLAIGFYTVTVTDSNGCTETETFHVDTIPALSIVLAATDVTCINTNNGTVDVTVIGGVPPYTFNWSNSATTEDISGLAAGSYTVTVTDNASQSASDNATIGSNPIYPDPVVGPISGPSSAQSWTLFNYTVPSSNGSSFNWTASGGSVITAVSNTAAVQWNAGPQGTVYVGETDANGCYGVDSLEITIIFVGIGEAHENSILVYPNPATDVLNIALPEVFSTPQLVIHNIGGEQVISARLTTLFETIDVSTLAKGTYIMTLFTEETSVKHKLVIQ